MDFLKKWRVEIITFLGLILIYFFLRFYHLLSLPIFTDEAIYVRWAQIAQQDSAQRFISLTDGKQPLFIWFAGFIMKFIHEPLLAARMVSVLAGFGTMLGLYFLGKELFKNRYIGLISAALYVVYPFGLVYDRMALYDSLVGTFYVWSLYVGIVLTKKLRLDVAFILGFILGGGALNKSIGLYSMYLLPLNLLIFNFKQKKKWDLLGKWIFFAGASAVIAEIMYAILRLSPWFYIIKQKDATFFYPLSDLFHKPITFWIANFTEHFYGLSGWLISYVSLPIVLLVILVFIFDRYLWKEKVLLFLSFILPFIGFAMIAKVMYPRYLLFMSLPLLPISGYAFYRLSEKIKNMSLFALVSIILLSFMLYADFYILTDFAKAPIPQPDLNQYSNDWPAGGGVKESVQFFEQQAKNKKIFVGTEGTFGLLPYALEIYLINNPNITIKGYWPVKTVPPEDLIAASKKMPAYIIFYQPCPDCSSSGFAPTAWPLTVIARYKKGISNTYLSIYQVKK